MDPATYPTSEQFKDLLFNHVGQEDELVRKWFFSGVPYVFRGQEPDYRDMKDLLASDCLVHPDDICLVGSGRLGFSPAPNKYGKKFADGADLDIIVVSSPLFDDCWIDFLNFKVRPPLGAPEHLVRRITETAERGFFWGHLNPGPLARYSTRATQWARSFRGLSARPSLSKWSPKGRLYRTWDHALIYHVHGVRSVTAELTSRRANQ